MIYSFSGSTVFLSDLGSLLVASKFLKEVGENGERERNRENDDSKLWQLETTKILDQTDTKQIFARVVFHFIHQAD